MSSASFIRACLPVEITDMRGNLKARILCGSCGVRAEWSVVQRVPPERVRKHFIGLGWRVQSKPLCPDCQAKRKEKPVTKPAATLSVAAPTTIDARAARRDAHERIDITFDIAAGRYKDGYSDERIAKETGVGLDWVRKRREEEFGPLKEPKEIGEMRGEIAGLIHMAEQIEKRLSDLAKRNGWAA